MKSLLVPSVAKYTFNKIKKNFENFGYKLDFDSELEKVTDKTDTFQQSFKIHSFDTTYGKVFTIRDDAPVLEIRLMCYENPSIFVGQQYNLWAHIDGTTVYDWEGEDYNLQQLVDTWLNEADEAIANAYSDWDYLAYSTDKDSGEVEKLNEGLISSLDLDGLAQQVKESNDPEALEELNAKVDTILDALGLVDEEDEADKEEDNAAGAGEIKHIEAMPEDGDTEAAAGDEDVEVILGDEI